MKKTSKALWLAGVLAQAATGCAGVQALDIDRSGVIRVSSLVPDSPGQRDFAAALQAGKEVVVLIPKGQALPVKLRLVLPMANLEALEDSLVFTRDTYVLLSTSRMMISPDGEHWAPMGDFAAQNELYDTRRKELHVGFGVNEEEGFVISMEAVSQ